MTCLKKIMLATTLGAFIAPSAFAGVTVYKEGDKFVEVGGRIQLQYHLEDEEPGEVTDELFFRRFRPYVKGGLHPDWSGKLQWEMGGASDTNELQVKDAFFSYKGLSFMNIHVGNKDFAFSRELLTSSKKTQLVERTFVGDHNYGTPDKNLGVHVDGSVWNKKIIFAAAAASASIDPDADKLDFDTPVNRNGDFNEGWMVGGRAEFQPLAPVKFSQGDMTRKLRFTVGGGAFVWNNDEDNNTNTDPVTGLDTSGDAPDVDRVIGTEISAGFRGYGISADVQANTFKATLVDDTYTGGMYRDGETLLRNFSTELGYMVLQNVLEVVAGVQSQDADNYDEIWVRRSAGVNYFIHKHDIKVQFTYQQGSNIDGIKDNDANEYFVQGQYVF